MSTPPPMITLIRPINEEDESLWLVEQTHLAYAPRQMVARRFQRSLLPLEEEREALKHSVEVAQNVEHANVTKIFGYSESEDEIFVLMENVEGLNLRQVLCQLQAQSQTLDPRLSVWLIREIVRVLNELSAQTGPATTPFRFNAELSLDRIVVSRMGQIKISDLGRDQSKNKKSELETVLAMLDALIAASDQSLLIRAKSLFTKEALGRASLGLCSDLNSLESALDRIFYRVYEGDDEKHGANLLSTIIIDILGEPTHPDRTDGTTKTKTLPWLQNAKGELTQALESRHKPVVPQAFTAADRVTGFETVTFTHNSTSSNLPVGALNARLSHHQTSPSVTIPHQVSEQNTPVNEATPKPSRIIWFTIGFVSAIASMILYLSVISTN